MSTVSSHHLTPGQSGAADLYRHRSSQRSRRPNPPKTNYSSSWLESPSPDRESTSPRHSKSVDMSRNVPFTGKAAARHVENVDAISPVTPPRAINSAIASPSNPPKPATAWKGFLSTIKGYDSDGESLVVEDAPARTPSVVTKGWKCLLSTTKYYDSDGESLASEVYNPRSTGPPKPPNTYQRFKRYMQSSTAGPTPLPESSRDNLSPGTGDLEAVRTISRVPGNTNYYEKNGLRTEGDGVDHEHEPPMNWKRFMVLVAMAFLWSGSQIPLYLFGAYRMVGTSVY